MFTKLTTLRLTSLRHCLVGIITLSIISGSIACSQNDEGVPANASNITLTDPMGRRSGDPHPDPVPQGGKIRTTPGRTDTTPILVVGLPESVQGAGTVIVENITASDNLKSILSNGIASRVETQATTDGTFTALVLAKKGDILAVSYQDSAPIQVEVGFTMSGIHPTPPPFEPLPDIPFIERSEYDPAKVIIRGMLIVEEPVPGVDYYVIAVNLDNGYVGLAKTDENFNFNMELIADTKERIHIYQDSSVLTRSLNLSAP